MPGSRATAGWYRSPLQLHHRLVTIHSLTWQWWAPFCPRYFGQGVYPQCYYLTGKNVVHIYLFIGLSYHGQYNSQWTNNDCQPHSILSNGNENSLINQLLSRKLSICTSLRQHSISRIYTTGIIVLNGHKMYGGQRNVFLPHLYNSNKNIYVSMLFEAFLFSSWDLFSLY